MSETIITKKCSKCKDTKSLSEFHKSRATKDGHQYNCKVCQYQRLKKWLETKVGRESYRKSGKKYNHTKRGQFIRKIWQQSEKSKQYQKKHYIENPAKYKAYRVVNNAIRIGKLPRPDSLQCHYCHEQAREYHHHKGYAPEHWLDVVPVCAKCHKDL